MAERVNGQPQMVYVEWIDSTRTEGWCTRGEVAAIEPLECKTAGFLVREDDRAIVVALSASHPDAGSPWCSLITIPKQIILLRADLVAHYPATTEKVAQ